MSWRRIQVTEAGRFWVDHVWSDYRIAQGYGDGWDLFKGQRYVRTFASLAEAKRFVDESPPKAAE